MGGQRVRQRPVSVDLATKTPSNIVPIYRWFDRLSIGRGCATIVLQYTDVRRSAQQCSNTLARACYVPTCSVEAVPVALRSDLSKENAVTWVALPEGQLLRPANFCGRADIELLSILLSGLLAYNLRYLPHCFAVMIRAGPTTTLTTAATRRSLC